MNARSNDSRAGVSFFLSPSVGCGEGTSADYKGEISTFRDDQAIKVCKGGYGSIVAVVAETEPRNGLGQKIPLSRTPPFILPYSGNLRLLRNGSKT